MPSLMWRHPCQEASCSSRRPMDCCFALLSTALTHHGDSCICRSAAAISRPWSSLQRLQHTSARPTGECCAALTAVHRGHCPRRSTPPAPSRRSARTEHSLLQCLDWAVDVSITLIPMECSGYSSIRCLIMVALSVRFCSSAIALRC